MADPCILRKSPVLGWRIPFEIPERLEVVAALPHTDKGALDRRAVEDQYAR
jgi:non-ribosomal peptide synthetase component E (peptide arylation enzyme)